MLGPIHLNRLMRRYGRVAVLLAGVLAAVAVLATARTAMMSGHEHHRTGHDAVVLCVTVGACALAVLGTAVAVRRLLQRPLWLLADVHPAAQPFVATPAPYMTRAGPPPPLLQVFRL